MTNILMSREWGMPSKDTFDCQPIEGFVKKYLMKSKVSVDPFARNKRWCTHTNDLNPETAAEYHMEADLFLNMLMKNDVIPDLVIFDPPYSLTQVSRSYDDIGLKFNGSENPTGGFPVVRDYISFLAKPDSIVLSFGWNSVGMGKRRGFDILEIMLVCHGGNHNDTICMAEVKTESPQAQLFEP